MTEKRKPGRPQIYDPEQTFRVLLLMSEDLRKQLDEKAAQCGLSRTAAIQEAIRRWLKVKRC